MLGVRFWMKTRYGKIAKYIATTGDYSILKNESAAAKTIIMFLVVVLIFTGVFGTVALNLNNLGANNDVAAIPGATAILSVVGILGIVIIVMWAIKRAF